MLRVFPAIRNNAFSFRRLYHYTPRQGIYTYNYYQKSPMPKGPLNFNAGPLVWIDCEMTGLNPQKDKIIEIAVLITNGNLDIVDEGLEYVIKTDKALLDGMDDWCTEQHGRSGLTKACLESPHTMESVSKSVLEYIKKWVPTERIGVLAGNSVHADRMFLAAQMPEIIDHLHYRIVGTLASLVRASRHPSAALDDIRGSIKELQWYRENVFVNPSAVQHKTLPK
ncbi:hypothetical protein D9619_001968 [Psilocybe cf. subviscida]|uniref:Exonuclease domain-containing protein n=1 Tax=Psilocybe cf. subviscida TaxID=2480587 RepID=A0A8H5BF36_9AGAR|nr:hypothetical protein D9619_001968 [Psilocybe cf. subviscida]